MLYERWLQWRTQEMQRSDVFIPEVSQPEYYDRDSTLKMSGFMEWERKWFVSRNFNGAGIQKALSDRQELRMLAKLTFNNWNQYQKDISAYYQKNGWMTRDGRKNPFRLLDFTKDKNDIGDTPQPKRGRHPTDYQTGKRVTTTAPLRKQIDDMNQRIVRAMSQGNSDLRYKLEAERNRLQEELDRGG